MGRRLLTRSVFRLARPLWQGRKEEAHAAHVFWPADFCLGEDFRADKVPGGTRESQARLRPRHDGISSEGETNCWTDIVKSSANESSAVQTGPQRGSSYEELNCVLCSALCVPAGGRLAATSDCFLYFFWDQDIAGTANKSLRTKFCLWLIKMLLWDTLGHSRSWRQLPLLLHIMAPNCSECPETAVTSPYYRHRSTVHTPGLDCSIKY